MTNGEGSKVLGLQYSKQGCKQTKGGFDYFKTDKVNQRREKTAKGPGDFCLSAQLDHQFSLTTKEKLHITKACRYILLTGFIFSSVPFFDLYHSTVLQTNT